MEQVYKLTTGFKVFFWILAILCLVLVVLFPGTILLVYLIFTAEVRITDKTLQRTWLGTKTVAWGDITELSWLPTKGALAAMMKPLQFVAKSADKTVKASIPVGVFERSGELIAELQKRSGKSIS
jgi:hypothetical protein